MFKDFDSETLERAAQDLHDLSNHHLEQKAWHKSFKDGAAGAKKHEDVAKLLDGFVQLLEQSLLERKILETIPPTQ